ncbi:MAG TPA: FtsX-like permease family protein [Longimicrobiales bacterium]|nr:FtsX-like permease family protein [Longimicrobiales bacterium]
MNRFPFLLARWEGRHALTRVGVYMLSISLGVAALVAVRSFRADVSRSIRSEAQVLMGADVRLSSRRPLPDSVGGVVDSLAAAGHRQASLVTAASMVLAPGSGNVRLLQVRAVEGDWPFYGTVRTTPTGRWGAWRPGEVLVDPAVLTQLQVGLGDTLRVGERAFRIAGTVEDLPTDLGFQTAVGPRVYLPLGELSSTGIVGFGSLARYETFLEIADAGDRAAVETRYDDVLRDTQVGFETAEEQARDLTQAVGFLGRYLGLVGLGALLLGGIGVGSAIHVFVKERLTEVAVLRCLGARQASVFLSYLLQAAVLGLLGSLLGAAVGVALQQLLPLVLAGALPVQVDPRVGWLTILGGVGMGVWVAVTFALFPLLSIRDAPPLRALRHALEPARRGFDPWKAGAVGVVVASVVALAILEAPSPGEGVAFAAALAVTAALLWGMGSLLVGLAPRLTPVRAPYTLRQGLSNLFRPQNQTVSVTLALGFGAFVVGTVLLVRDNLTRELTLQAVEGQPNLLLFDIQADQRDGVVALLPPAARSQAEVTSLVPARLSAVNGLDRAELQQLPYEEQPERWAVRRDYRHTFRWELTEAETLVAGAWWDEAPRVEEGVARISMEAEVAQDLKVGVGDRVTWEISGIQVESEIVSLREVDWSRFQTNFFVVFEPGSLDEAPSTYVILARMEGEEGRAAFQRSLVERFPNVSVLDVTRLQEAVDAILSKVTQAIAFLALFAAVAGILVLAGALASSRHQRVLEGALLRTLGARRPQVLAVLFAEYLALGVLATLAGLGLALAASGILVSRAFEIPFQVDLRIVGGIWLGVSLLTLVTGMMGSRDLLRRPPLPVLRGE